MLEKRGRLLSSVALAAWFAFLSVLAALYANEGFVSLPQLAAADHVVEATVDAVTESGAVEATVERVYKGGIARGTRIHITGISQAAIARLKQGERWILPLTTAGDEFQITRYPLRTPVRIYRATPSTRKQVMWSLQRIAETTESGT